MDEIVRLLDLKRVAFARWEDTGIRDRQWEEWRNHLPGVYDLPLPFVPRSDFIELAPEAVADVEALLAAFGIFRIPSDSGPESPTVRPHRAFLGCFVLAAGVTLLLLVWSFVHPLFNRTLSGSHLHGVNYSPAVP